jgi:hypothetical protein
MGTCQEPATLGEPCDPREWLACASPEDPSRPALCDPTTHTCVTGPLFCADLNFPPWSP